MNKKLLLLPMMLVLAVGFVSADPFSYGSLVLYLPFEEGSGTTAGDQSGFGHDGTLTGDVNWATTGIKGGAIELHGNDDYVALGNPAALDIGEAGTPSTLSVWAKADVVTQGKSYLFSKSGSAMNILTRNSYTKQFFGKTWGGNVKSTTSFTPNVWHHVVVSWDGVNTYKIYVDGVLEDTVVGTSSGWGNAQTRVSASGTNSLDGIIDEVAIWNVALTDSEVLEVYNAALAPPDNTTPSVPQNLVSTGQTETTIDLAWDASSDPESGIANYKVFRDNVLVASPAGTTYTDTGLTQNTAYTYEVSAVNGAGLESARSTGLVVSTLADTQAPTIVDVNATSSQVFMLWSEPVDSATATNAANYNIPGLTVGNATLLPDGVTVVLATSDASEYTVTATGVEDVNGNTAPDSETYNVLGCFI